MPALHKTEDLELNRTVAIWERLLIQHCLEIGTGFGHKGYYSGMSRPFFGVSKI